MQQFDFLQLPSDLPVPIDDGAADHLVGQKLPIVSLRSTGGGSVDVSKLPPGRTVLFAYPMTGRPDVALPEGRDDIPGARGCTPQNCGFRDLYDDFLALGVTVYAVSTQPTAYQREMTDRLHVPYPVLSDAAFELTQAVRLPTFETGGMRLLKRLTMVVRDGTIEHVFYPVFPSDRSADDTLTWLRNN